MAKYLPMQDTNGSVLGLANNQGKLVEKVQYNDFGTVKFEYDHVKPRVDVARLAAGTILIRFSESITLPTGKDPIKLTHSGIDVPGTVILEDDDRVALFNPASNLVNGQSYTLTITIDLEDKHQNTLAEEFSQPFTYLGTDAIVYDRTAPEVEKVELTSDVYHVTLTEEYDPATLPSSVDIFTSTKTYVGTVTSEGPRQFTFTTSLALDTNTEYTFRVKTSLKDLAGKNLLEFTTKYAYDGSDDVLFEKPSETLHGESFVKNNVLFQGREYDPETGLYYFRARYYDPKLGLFLQPDPMGYQDSMNPYQAFGNNAVNFSDPSGMVVASGVNPRDVEVAYRKLRRSGVDPDTAYWKLVKQGLISHQGYQEDINYQFALGMSHVTSIVNTTPAKVGKNALAGAISGVLGLVEFATTAIAAPVSPIPTTNPIRDLRNKINKALGANTESAEYFLAELWTPAAAGGILAGNATGAISSETTVYLPKLQTITNPIPTRLARVIPGEISPEYLGPPSSSDVFVTAADDIAGLNAKQIAERLAIKKADSYIVIEFDTPMSGIGSPVNRNLPGFVGRGRTAGGAREFVIPNAPIPKNAIIRRVK